MPIHPDIAARFPLLDGLTSLREAYGTPAGREQIARFEAWEPAVPPPAVDVRDTAAPGPHGPVPVRVYGPAPDGDPARPAWSGCTAARSSAATWTCPRRTGPRGRSAPGPAPSWSASTTGWPWAG